TDLDSADALAVLGVAPTPELGRRLSISKIASALRRGGRQRNVERRAAEIQAALRAEHLQAPPVLSDAYGTPRSLRGGAHRRLQRTGRGAGGRLERGF